MKKISTLVIIVFISCSVFAQDNDSTLSKAELKLSLNFNSNLNYYGRTDSLKSTGIFPLAELWFNKHFYINAAPVFVNNAVQSFQYAGTVATAGYQQMSEKWLTHLYLLKPFYKESSSLVQSALKAQAGLSFSHLNPFLNLTLGGDVKFSDKADFGATAGLDHIIRVQTKNGGVLVFDPSAYVYAGTQNFTNTYYRKNNLPLLQGNNQRVTENVQQFNILAYEATLPLIYAKDSWMFLATPSYIVPQNLLTVEGRPDLSERGENLFYMTLAIKKTF